MDWILNGWGDDKKAYEEFIAAVQVNPEDISTEMHHLELDLTEEEVNATYTAVWKFYNE